MANNTPYRPMSKRLGRPMGRPVRSRASEWTPPGTGAPRARVASPHAGTE
jgi:hypothetical protein